MNFAEENCEASYPAYKAQTFRVSQAGVWESHSYSGALASDYKSIGIVIGAWARESGVQRVWIDDVFLHPR